MADNRNVSTKMWVDNWFVGLSPESKLLFVYLFTNDRAALAGIYELPLRVMVFETGLSEDTVLHALDEFAQAKKAFYADGVVWVVNLRKYNDTGSGTVQVRILKDVAALPDDNPLVQKYCEVYGISDASLGRHRPAGPGGRGAEGRVPYPLTDAPVDQLVAALAEVTGMDPYIGPNRTKLDNAATNLNGRYDSGEILKKYGKGGIWYTQHWKGQKGQRPTLADITTTIQLNKFSEAPAAGPVTAASDARRAELEELFGPAEELEY